MKAEMKSLLATEADTNDFHYFIVASHIRGFWKLSQLRHFDETTQFAGAWSVRYWVIINFIILIVLPESSPIKEINSDRKIGGGGVNSKKGLHLFRRLWCVGVRLFCLTQVPCVCSWCIKCPWCAKGPHLSPICARQFSLKLKRLRKHQHPILQLLMSIAARRSLRRGNNAEKLLHLVVRKHWLDVFKICGSICLQLWVNTGSRRRIGLTGEQI